MYTIFGIPNCDTIKKTIAWFEQNQISYRFHDYKKEGISSEKLTSWIAQQPLEILINRAGTTFKALSDEQKAAAQDPSAAVAVMRASTSIIKRPIIEVEGQIVKVGWKPAGL